MEIIKIGYVFHISHAPYLRIPQGLPYLQIFSSEYRTCRLNINTPSKSYHDPSDYGRNLD